MNRINFIAYFNYILYHGVCYGYENNLSMVKFTQIISFEFKITTSNDIITKLTEGVKKMYLEELCGDEKDYYNE